MSIPTKQDFLSYERVRKEGNFNMYGKNAIDATGLDTNTYMSVMRNHSELTERYKNG